MAENRLTIALKHPPLIKLLIELKGDPRICIITEPL